MLSNQKYKTKMKFTTIDLDHWNRKKYFELYYQNIPCTYSLTIKLDISKIIAQNKHLYSTLLFCLTRLINRHQEFRTCFNKDGKLGFYDELLPSYTVFNSETETFTNIWSLMHNNYEDFYKEYKKDIETYGKTNTPNGKPNTPENVYNVSMIPWVSFDSFNLNLKKGYDYLLPIFTFGKYYQENQKHLIPLSIQVHHAVCDGFHVGRFINEFQEMLNELE